MLEIRAGIHDEKILKPCKAHSDEQIIERYKFVVAMTGQGPIGKCTGAGIAIGCSIGYMAS